jgi:hypothetical protein
MWHAYYRLADDHQAVLRAQCERQHLAEQVRLTHASDLRDRGHISPLQARRHLWTVAFVLCSLVPGMGHPGGVSSAGRPALGGTVAHAGMTGRRMAVTLRSAESLLAHFTHRRATLIDLVHLMP